VSLAKYDAIVIGAGSVGCPIAYFLTLEGMKVLVVDREHSAGQGQNKAAIGGVRATHSDPAKIAICLESLGIFSSWKEKHGTDIGWIEGGYCFPIYREIDEEKLKLLLPVQKSFGLGHQSCRPARRHLLASRRTGLAAEGGSRLLEGEQRQRGRVPVR